MWTESGEELAWGRSGALRELGAVVGRWSLGACCLDRGQAADLWRCERPGLCCCSDSGLEALCVCVCVCSNKTQCFPTSLLFTLGHYEVFSRPPNRFHPHLPRGFIHISQVFPNASLWL